MSKMNNSSVALQTFDYQGSEVHVEMDSNGDPWFQASTVCPILGIDTRHLRRMLDTDEITEAPNVPNWHIGNHGGKSPLFVSEAGLYTLCLRSNNPKAKPFRRWVTHEVLPSLRKTGSYSLPASSPASAPVSDEELLSRAVLVATDKIQRLETANRELANENEMLKPKAAYADMVGAAENTLTMPQMAKILSSHGFPGGVVKLYRKLREDHVVYRKHGRNLPCQRYVDAGLFTARISPFEAKGHHFNGVTMLVTAKGSRWLAARYCPAAAALEGSEPLVLDAAPVVPTWQTACFVEEERDYQGEGYPILHVFDSQTDAEDWAATHNGQPIDRKRAKAEAGDITGLRVEALGWTWDGTLNALRDLPASDDAKFAQAVADVYALDAGPWTGGIIFHC